MEQASSNDGGGLLEEVTFGLFHTLNRTLVCPVSRLSNNYLKDNLRDRI